MTLCEVKYRYLPLKEVTCPEGCGGITDDAGKCRWCGKVFELEQTLRVISEEGLKLRNL